MLRHHWTADLRLRLLLIAAIGLLAAIGLTRLQVTVDIIASRAVLVFIAILGAIAVLLTWLQNYHPSFVLVGSARFFSMSTQLLLFALAAGSLQYVASAANFPLVDAALQRTDAALSFDWQAYRDWVARHPTIHALYGHAYFSVHYQGGMLVLAHTMLQRSFHPELLLCLTISVVLVLATAAVFPALGYPGEIGQAHIQSLMDARQGRVAQLAGIVTFPSFHAALGVIFTWSARACRPLLVLAVPLNALLILATPPFGGHYLVDVIAGIAVAIVTILLVRHIQSLPSDMDGLPSEKNKGRIHAGSMQLPHEQVTSTANKAVGPCNAA
jgi:hypothetical protein